MPFVALVGTVLYGFAYAQSLVPPEAPAIAGLALCGIGYFGITLFLFCELAKIEKLSVALWAIAASLFLKTILGDAVGILSDGRLQVAVAAILPWVSFASLEAMRKLGTDEHLKRYRASRTITKPEKRNLLYVLVAVSMIVAALRGLGHLGFWGEGYLGSPVASLVGYPIVGAAFVGFTYAALVRNANNRMLVRFQPAFFVVIGGFLVYVIQDSFFDLGSAKPLFSWLSLSVELFAHLLSWAVVLTAIRTTTDPVWRFQGISDASYGIVAILWAILLQSAEGGTQMLIAIAVLLSLAAAIRPLSKKPLPEEFALAGSADRDEKAPPDSIVERSLKDETSVEERIVERHRALAKAYRLSPRETDVFLLLAQGHSRPYISNELFLSDGTVKTHVTHIYRKFDVHSREELLASVRTFGKT